MVFAGEDPVVGFDINAERIDALRVGQDSTQEVEPKDLTAATGLTFTSEPSDLAGCDTFIYCDGSNANHGGQTTGFVAFAECVRDGRAYSEKR